MNDLPKFDTKDDAISWLVFEAMKDEDCVDNIRFAYVSDGKEMKAYEDAANSGCCGSFDRTIIVGGQPAIIGCNYGH